MKKIFKLNGLDCASCAAKIEDKIGKLDGVHGSTVNFVTTKLTIEAEEDRMSEIIESARAIIKKMEPGVIMEKA